MSSVAIGVLGSLLITCASPIRILVKRILGKHEYPTDKQERATQTVLEQAALLSAGWVAA